MVQSTINKEEQYQKYREAVVPLIMKFGGKFSIRGGKVEVLEGQPIGGQFWTPIPRLRGSKLHAE
jgi:uncharacterized protein (DUF1330 family)